MLSADARLDQIFGILASKGVLVIAHMLFALAMSFVVPKSGECDRHAQYRIPLGICHPAKLQTRGIYSQRQSGQGRERWKNARRQKPRRPQRTKRRACSRSIWPLRDPIRNPFLQFSRQPNVRGHRADEMKDATWRVA